MVEDEIAITGEKTKSDNILKSTEKKLVRPSSHSTPKKKMEKIADKDLWICYGGAFRLGRNDL